MITKRQRLDTAKATVRTYGFSVEGEGLFADELEVCTPETCFVIEDDDVTHVIMWTGSYPFANDHPQGALPSVWEAASHAKWLLQREDFYEEREQAKRDAWEAEPCNCLEFTKPHLNGDH